jgi:hypothetical protein
MSTLVSLLQETYASTTLHLRECSSQRDSGDWENWGNGINQTGRHQARVAKYTILLNFILFIKLLLFM